MKLIVNPSQKLTGRVTLPGDKSISHRALLLGAMAAGVTTARNWLNALDVHTKEAGEQIYVYFVQNGLANDIGDILNQVYGLKSSSGGRPDRNARLAS